MRPLVALLVLALLAGCTQPTGPAPEPTSTGSEVPVFAFDGHGAYDYVEDLVTHEDGSPRYRVPGTPGHASAAHWLQGTMGQGGWTVQRHTFNGTQYDALDLSSVSAYAHGGSCRSDDKEELDELVFHNLVATWNGSGSGSLLLGAHWDSKEDASDRIGLDGNPHPVLGANDGASGVGVLLRLMGHISAGELNPAVGSLTVVFFDGEDGFEDCHPLAGSLYHAQTQPLPDGMVLLDMVGDANASFPRVHGPGTEALGLVELLFHHGARAGLGPNLKNATADVLDDHRPFMDQGVPAVDIIDMGNGFPEYWHTTNDTMKNIDATMLGRVGAMVATTLEDPQLATILALN